MHYYIIGTDHKLQRKSPFRDKPDTGLRDRLAEIISTHPIALIAEEVDADRHNTQIIYGRELANKHDPVIPWVPIDMNLKQEEAAGISVDLERAAKCRESNHRVYPERANTIREWHWLDTIEFECKTRNLTSGTVLVTCGIDHLGFFCQKVRTRASMVESEELPRGLDESLGPLTILL